MDSKRTDAANYGRLPLSFEANQGQAAPGVDFLSRGNGYSLFLSAQGAAFAFNAPGTAPVLIRMSLFGSRPNAAAVGDDPLPGKVNYFLGNNPAKWHANLPTFAKVHYTSPYRGIDLVYYGNQQQLEYDFIVAPGADSGTIQLRLDGEKSISISPDGDLLLGEKSGFATFHKPLIYQQANGQRQAIPGDFKLAANHTVTFAVGPYDRSLPLVIDPVLVYSTYLGGAGEDSASYQYAALGKGIAVDSEGNAYVVGTTWESSPGFTPFPVTGGAFQSTLKGNNSVFVSKFNATGTQLLYSTILGGSGQPNPLLTPFGDLGNAIAIDSSGNAYVTGTTSSSDFPVTSGAFQTTNAAVSSTYPASTGFITKLNSSGSALVYSTFLGGSGDPYKFGNVGNAITVNSAGEAYIAGSTAAGDFPVTVGAFQAKCPTHTKADPQLWTLSQNAFVTKLNAGGTGLVFSTYLGGSGVLWTYFASGKPGGDIANAIVIDGSGNVYVAGSTANKDFPVTSGAFQTANHGFANHQPNAFITKLNPTGSAEIYSSFLGGSGPVLSQYAIYAPDAANAIALNSSGNLYVGGVTNSTDFPTTAGAFTTTNSGRGTGFVAKLNSNGSSLVYSSILGGDNSLVNGIAVNPAGFLFATGVAKSDSFPTSSDSLLPNTVAGFSANKAFLVKLNPTGSAVNSASLLGGTVGLDGPFDTRGEVANAIALDGSGNLYVTGFTYSADFPTSADAFQKTSNATYFALANAFVSKLDFSAETTESRPSQISLASSFTFTATNPVANITATVTAPTLGTTPQGSVTFYGTGLTTTTLPLDADGTVTWTPSSLKPGKYIAFASYSGDASHLSSLVAPTNGPSFRVVGPAYRLYVISGPAPAGHPYGGAFAPYLVQVSDITGYPEQGVPVSFSGAGLAFSPAVAITDINGQVAVRPVPQITGNLTVTISVQGVAQPATRSISMQPAPLTLTLQSLSRGYGYPNPTLRYTVAGLVNSDTATVTPQTTATIDSPAGLYPITATISATHASNYAITVKPARLLVFKDLLSIVLKPQKPVYGQGPSLPIQYSFVGFVHGDAPTVVSGAPSLTTTVTSASPVGYYPVQFALGTLAATNYHFAVNPQSAVISILKAPLTAKADDISMPVGGPLPTLTYTLTGFVNGDTAASSVTGAAVLSTTATTHSKVGNYPIYISTGTLASHNYHITAAIGVLKIEP